MSRPLAAPAALILAWILAATVISPLQGQGAGSAASTLLRLAPAPRPLSLGNAGAALPGAWAGEYNPALPAVAAVAGVPSSSRGLALAYQELPLDAATGGATGAAALGPGVATATLRFVDYGEVAVVEYSPTSPVGDPTGATATGGEVALGIGYAVRWGPAAVGIAARWLRLDVAGLRDDAVGADIGIALRAAPGLTLGVAAQNLGRDVAAGRASPAPRTWRGGISYGRGLGDGGSTALLSVEARRREEQTGVGAGVEVQTDIGRAGAALRVGYETRPSAGDAFAPLVFGGGVRVDRFSVELAYRTLGPLGSTRLIGLSYAF